MEWPLIMDFSHGGRGHCSVLFEEGKCSENILKGVALQICTVRNSIHIDRDE